MGLASMAAKPFDLWLRWCIRSGRRYGFKKRSNLEWVSDMAERHRNAEHIVPDKTLDYSQWVYEAGQTVETKRIYRCDDAAGRTGWIAHIVQKLGPRWKNSLGDFDRLVAAAGNGFCRMSFAHWFGKFPDSAM